MAKRDGRKSKAGGTEANEYRHTQAESPLRPDVGTQAQFRKKKPPAKYRYDSSLSPALDWDGQNPAREQGEARIAQLQAQIAALRALKPPSPLAGEGWSEADEPISPIPPSPLVGEGWGEGETEAFHRALARMEEELSALQALSRPFLNWAGKAERLSFDVPTLPLFVHERLSTKAIIETLKGHRRDKTEALSLFGDPGHPVSDQVLRAYEYRDKWVNRMILGDSLVVMNSLLHYEGLGGQVQMIYMDPPYGVKFGSNFQPFVRKRDVKHNDDQDMTREPEMVKAYRDTWELGLHSYLTYMRDRLLLCRELLHPSGSIFVQISDENLHHLREVMDEVFGPENFGAVIPFKKTSALGSARLDAVNDYLLWYAKSVDHMKYRQLYLPVSEDTYSFTWVRLPDGTERRLTAAERDQEVHVEGRLFRTDNLTSQSGGKSTGFPYEFGGKVYQPSSGSFWKTNLEGMNILAKAGRLIGVGNTLAYKRYADDFPVRRITAWWEDTVPSTFATEKFYAVQTYSKVIVRCLQMTTDPGDLVLDPTCGSGTTAYVAEQWGRRWITVDISRVPLALARQRLLTATFPWYELKSEAMGPAGGFVYKRKQNSKGEEVGGIVPHVTLKSIANDEPPAEEVLVDRPEPTSGITRVSGPFCVEATIPTPVDWEGDGVEDSGVAEAVVSYGSSEDRMLEVLRKSPVLHVGGKTVTLKNVRRPAKTLSLSAEAVVTNGRSGQSPGGKPSPLVGEGQGEGEKAVAFVFGPENGAVSEKLVYEAAREAHAKGYAHLYVIGFAIQPNARKLIEECEAAVGVPATYVQATPDLVMGDLLKNMRSSQIFSVCGLPEIKLRKVAPRVDGDPVRYQVELLGLDVFDPVTMETDPLRGDDVPAWLLDTDYNNLAFHVCQAFFPRTSAWDSLKRALRGAYEESVWDHLSGTVSAPFEAGEHGQVAVKVIDDRGNELLVVKNIEEATP